MKVKCIINKGCNDLTIGKTYEVIDEIANKYLINDDRDRWPYPKYWFKPLSDIRNEKIDKLLAE